MVSGSTNETKDRIVRAIRNADKPVLSAADIADRADYSKRTVNNHITRLVEDGPVEATEVGNATAYFISKSEYPRHDLPDHHCKRCGREVNSTDDLSRVATTLEYGNDKTTYNYILCRFCQSDLTSWLHGDDGSMYEYPHVHKWNIPDDQLEEVREDEDTQTMTDRNGTLDDIVWEVHEAVVELGGDTLDEGVTPDQIRWELEDKYGDYQIDEAVNTAKRAGLLFHDVMNGVYVAAK